MRPNIRVEIQNNLADEVMDVDENEEGELSENEETMLLDDIGKSEDSNTKTTKLNPSTLKNDTEKLQERAIRFSLKPNEITTFTPEEVHLLHSSLGISATEPNVRFDAIHMRGIHQMAPREILGYFLEYNPITLELIDEESCNVVWDDEISAGRALHFTSKAVRGMPVRESSFFDSLNEGEEEGTLVNENREVELKQDEEKNKGLNEDNSVDISAVNASIPPGYWRLGNKGVKKGCILMRFAFKTDKQPMKVEQFSNHYRNANKKNLKGVLGGIFGRNKEMFDDNPWATLAKNWDEDSQFREKERTEGIEPVKVKNANLRTRLGEKRKEEPEVSEEQAPKKKIKVPRMRMYADEEEEKIKRKKTLQKINHQIKQIDRNASTNSDLRTVLNMNSRTVGVKLEKAETESNFDLGSKLKNRNKKMVFEIKTEGERHRRTSESRHREKRHRHKHSESEEEDAYSRHGDYGRGKTRSKVAVVIKTQKRPAVASKVWSRIEESRSSESESEQSGSEKSESSSESENEAGVEARRIPSRPGFYSGTKEHSMTASAYRNPLKIEISNDHFRRT